MTGYTFQPPPPNAPDPDRDRAIDTILKERVLQAQLLSSDSPDQKLIISEIINIIYTSNRLSRNLSTNKIDFNHSRYQEFYDQAVFMLFSWLAQAIRQQKYNPERGEVLAWVNKKLKYLFIDAVIELTGVKTPYASGVDIENLDDHDKLNGHGNPMDWLIESETLDWSALWKAYQASDPDGLLSKRVTGSVTLQQLLDAKIMRKSMRALAEELGENQNTLSSVFGRYKLRFMNSFRQFCQAQGQDISDVSH